MVCPISPISRQFHQFHGFRYPVKPPQFYNPVTSLLLQDKEWSGMRRVGEIRWANNQKAPQNPDSQYKPIQRTERHFGTLTVPKKIAAKLPFKSKPKQLTKRSSKTYDTKRAVVLSGEELKVHRLVQQLSTVRNEKARVRKETNLKKRAVYLKKKAEVRQLRHHFGPFCHAFLSSAPPRTRRVM